MEENGKCVDKIEGKRYSDYDDLVMKRIIFKDKDFVKCCNCKKKLYKISEGYYAYLGLRCKECYIKICKQADEELGNALKEFI